MVKGASGLRFGLTGHLLDPTEGSEVTGGGCLLKQLKSGQKEDREKKREIVTKQSKLQGSADASTVQRN